MAPSSGLFSRFRGHKRNTSSPSSDRPSTSSSRHVPSPLNLDPLAPRKAEGPLTSPDFFFAGNFITHEEDASIGGRLVQAESRPETPRLTIDSYDDAQSSMSSLSKTRGSGGSFVPPSSTNSFASGPTRGPLSPNFGPQYPLRVDTGTTYSTTIPPQKSGKRLNLLNPLSMIRRKSSQNLSPTDSIPRFPDDYDPAIRGSVVHDFSAPRVSRSGSDYSYNLRYEEDGLGIQSLSPGLSSDKAHTPVFRECFDENDGALNNTEKGRDISPALSDSVPTDTSQGEFSQRSAEMSPPTSDDEDAKRFVAPLDDVVEEPSEGQGEDINRARSLEYTTSQRSGKSRTLLPSTSRASRFSFEVSGQLASAAQERMLEEAHKAKERAKVEKSKSLDPDDYFDDDFDMDDFDDGLEERIPGVNADDDDDDSFNRANIEVPTSMQPHFSIQDHYNMQTQLFLQNQLMQMQLQNQQQETIDHPPADHNESQPAEQHQMHIETSLTGFDFTSHLMSGIASPMSPMPPSMYTPVDASGQKIGFAMTKESPAWKPDPKFLEAMQMARSPLSESFGEPTITPRALKKHPPPAAEDEFYFDDGEFGQDVVQDNQEFNEDIFDDEDGPFAVKRQVQSLDRQKVDRSVPVRDILLDDDDDDDDKTPPIEPASQTLTHSNLALLDKALNAFSEPDDHTFTPVDDDLPDEFDDLENDPDIIAFANASVLANDDDGFYGSEFGFYAQSNNNNAEAIAGGFFVKDEGLKRSRSGKAIEEPNLTPITERSECSARNSFATSMFGDGKPPPATPDLRQIERNLESGADVEDMSMSTLLKLRRGAFGGSNGSLRSAASGGSQGLSSPLVNSMTFGHNRMSSSGLSIDSNVFETPSPVSPIAGAMTRGPRKDSFGSASSPLASTGPRRWRVDGED